ncbi:1,4-alpha-glucan branching protein domain-containing protein [Chloroflexus sp.]|uniref:1,4-alpha-glucan branching protein domain-containing protein n=1 Tax=Chloroflexus sp. TaxID=1904827 RepID=UPI00260F3665|nr:1,4-alpha-glucan branching protein domain-containing protein [uncultured Chloroflexus sp.]
MPVAFIIEAHTLYVRHPGRHPIGEEQLHIATAQMLIPLLDLLGELQRHQLPIVITLACSPIALEQWRDPIANKHFTQWLETRIARHQAELNRFEAEGDRHGAYLARFYLDWDRQTLRTFITRYQRNLVGRLQELVSTDVIVPLCTPASYAILPLLSHENIARAQLEHGLLYISRHLKRPEGLWLPGYAWRPGLEQIALDLELRYVLVDPVSVATGHLPGWIIPRRLAAIGVETELARQIESSEIGYPGDPLYRNPADPSGYTANGTFAPQPYDPYEALRRAQEHANHFVEQLLCQLNQLPADATLVVPINARCWGTHWFEGPTWLQAVLTRCATDTRLRLTHPGTIITNLRPGETVTIQSESPEAQSVERALRWQSVGAQRYWHALHDAEHQFVDLAAHYLTAEGLRERVLTQAARELLLAEQYDWAEEPQDSGWQRHLDRFEQLLALARQESLSATDLFALEQIESHDAIFPVLNYRLFGKG